jgi:hypothetical protein
LLDSPFIAIGESDSTAHVEWTTLAEKAEASGLGIAGFADQHHFLTGIISESPRIAEEGSPKTRRALQTLLHPEMLGRSFQVLALSKGIDPAIRLGGFKFARDPRAALGLIRRRRAVQGIQAESSGLFQTPAPTPRQSGVATGARVGRPGDTPSRYSRYDFI